MTDMRYFGRYADFKTTSKEMGVRLTGPDFIIGDTCNIEFRNENRRTTAWIVNKFGADIGYLDQTTTDRLDLFRARGWSLHCLLVQVLYTNTSEGGNYWGRVALIATEKKYDEAVQVFIQKLADAYSQDVRPVIDLSQAGIDTLIAKKGDWQPDQTLPLESLEKGTVNVKSQRSLLDHAVVEGRKGNPGCYFVSWIFIIVALVLVCGFTARALGVVNF